MSNSQIFTNKDIEYWPQGYLYPELVMNKSSICVPEGLCRCIVQNAGAYTEI